jgi:hypothetical protein
MGTDVLRKNTAGPEHFLTADEREFTRMADEKLCC